MRRSLPADVHAAYRRLARLLAPMHVVSHADAVALELSAVALAEVDRYGRVLAQLGTVYETTTERGSVMIRPRPEVALHADAWRRLAASLQWFGLTPSARSKVEALPLAAPAGEDPLERLRRRAAGALHSSSKWAGLLP